jgi:hypothetical protein
MPQLQGLVHTGLLEPCDVHEQAAIADSSMAQQAESVQDEQEHGGQAVVQMARNPASGMVQYAIKYALPCFC